MHDIYIHFPFCSKKCLYCNFYSIINEKYKEKYLKALLREIDLRKDYLGNVPIQTIYFGGGTPTIFSVKDLALVIEKLQKNNTFTPQMEITIEGNPEQLVSEIYLKELKAIGFNRLSIGVQSFNEQILQFLGRNHTVKQVLSSIDLSRKAGFENISIDLIYGIHERQNNDWTNELKHVAKLPIQHLSAYALTIEENTILYKKVLQKKVALPDEATVLNEFYELIDFAAQNGFEHYEVSNFAKQGYHSIHNSNYWDHVPYCGFGASAHSFNGLDREWNVANAARYIEAMNQNNRDYEIETLTPSMLFNEYILLKIRTKEGLDFRKIKTKFGENRLNHLLQIIPQLDASYYQINDEVFKLTPSGIAIADYITGMLFID